MISARAQAATIAAKEISDAWRTRLLLLITAFMILAGLVALVVAALAQKAEVEAYVASRDILLSLGKSAAEIAPPPFFPLRLLRGFIEYVEIIGAVLGLVLGHRAAAAERGRRTLALLLTRPLSQRALIAGKLAGNLLLIGLVLIATFTLGAFAVVLLGGVGLSADEYLRLATVVAAAILYVAAFFVLGFLLALHMRHLPNALLAAFTLWLVLVLIAPQVGDTLDPDNQIPGGVFRALGIPKPQEREILATFSTYETVRDAIEQISPAKHFERWAFAVTGIKEIYKGRPFGEVATERLVDLYWLVGLLAALLIVVFALPLRYTRLAKE